MPSRFWKASGNALLPGKGILTVSSAFSPSSLPGINAWYEAQDSSHIFSDAGTTTIVDTASVQQWNDKSGSHTLSQATSGQRPIWHAGSGKPYVEFDGTDDTLLSALSTFNDASAQAYVAISAYFASTVATPQLMIEAADPGSGNTNWLMRLNSAFIEGQAFNNVGSGTGVQSASAISAATPFVAIVTATSTAVEAFLNNVSGGTNTLTGTRDTSSTKLCVASVQGATTFAGMRVYGIVQGKGTLSSTDRGNLHTYLAALHP